MLTVGAADFNQEEFEPTQIHCPLDPYGFDLNLVSFLRHCGALFVKMLIADKKLQFSFKRSLKNVDNHWKP